MCHVSCRQALTTPDHYRWFLLRPAQARNIRLKQTVAKIVLQLFLEEIR